MDAMQKIAMRKIKIKDAARRILLGPFDFPQQHVRGLRDPQTEISVWLHGLESPLNVTHCHLMSGGAPFTITVGLDAGHAQPVEAAPASSLKFQHISGALLGEIALEPMASFKAGTRTITQFHSIGSRNYCLPLRHLWGRYLQYARQPLRSKDADVPISQRENRAMMVFYICPRPTVLVSASDGDHHNMFPMNLMGYLGDGYFGFALNANRKSAPLIERARRVALSSVPFSQASVVSKMGGNHRKVSTVWPELPFATARSPLLGLPVPEFALRVREMEVIEIKPGGSHTLFVARLLSDHVHNSDEQFFVEHGFYAAWRERQAQPMRSLDRVEVIESKPVPSHPT
jgi:flavin reductase (DIM6/NTAB) family NADH-FMN oxidoreductase RutF